MGCNCGGSTNTKVIEAQARQRAAGQAPVLTGPKAPGYTWDGPEGTKPELAAKPQPAK